MQVSFRTLTNLFSTQSSSPLHLNFCDQTHSAHLTLCNPTKRNPLSLQMIRLLKNNLIQIETKIKEKKLKVALHLIRLQY